AVVTPLPAILVAAEPEAERALLGDMAEVAGGLVLDQDPGRPLGDLLLAQLALAGLLAQPEQRLLAALQAALADLEVVEGLEGRVDDQMAGAGDELDLDQLEFGADLTRRRR